MLGCTRRLMSSPARRSADDARDASQKSFVTKIKSLPPWARYLFMFSVSFCVGASMEAFSIKTGLYESIVANKTNRRHDLDEFVADFRADLEKWQAEDMKIAEEKKRQEEDRMRAMLMSRGTAK